MTAVDNMLVVAYEVEGMSPEEISEVEELEVSVVKNTLMQHSSKYKQENKSVSQEENTSGISESEYQDILNGVKQIALYEEQSHTKLKASLYLIEEYKGRNDARARGTSKSGAPVVNINMGAALLNHHLRKAKEVSARIRQELLIEDREMELVS